MEVEETKKFTVEDLDACWAYHKDYLVEILNGDYSVESAREDLRSLIGGKHDPRSAGKEEKAAQSQGG